MTQSLLKIICILLSSTIAMSQSDLTKDYKLSEVKETRLIINPRAFANASNNYARLWGNLSLGMEHYHSDEKTQSLLTTYLSFSQTASYPRRHLSPINYSLNVRYNKKRFFSNNMYLELSPSVNINRTISDDRTLLTPSIRMGIGHGRIDKANELALLEFIIEDLGSGQVLDSSELSAMSMKVREWRNSRKFYNLGQSNLELESLFGMLDNNTLTNDALTDAINLSLLNKYYKYLPTLNRIDGRTIGLTSHVSTIYRHFGGDRITDLWRTFGQVGLSLNYLKADYKSHHFQLDKYANVSVFWLESYSYGYGIREEVGLEGSYYPSIDLRYTLRAGLYNRNHTLSQLFNYGFELGGGLAKAFSQRALVDLNLLVNFDFSEQILGRIAVDIQL